MSDSPSVGSGWGKPAVTYTPPTTTPDQWQGGGNAAPAPIKIEVEPAPQGDKGSFGQNLKFEAPGVEGLEDVGTNEQNASAAITFAQKLLSRTGSSADPVTDARTVAAALTSADAALDAMAKDGVPSQVIQSYADKLEDLRDRAKQRYGDMGVKGTPNSNDGDGSQAPEQTVAQRIAGAKVPASEGAQDDARASDQSLVDAAKQAYETCTDPDAKNALHQAYLDAQKAFADKWTPGT